MKYIIIGSTIAGNKGAASMFMSAVQQLSKVDKQADFVLLSYYPDEDTVLNPYKSVRVLNAKPLRLALVINTSALVWKIVPPLRKFIERKVDAIGELAQASVYLDQGGITFSDGREVFLIYNVAIILPALIMGVPVVKCAQAMGPFNNPINKLVSRLFLPRVTRIIARGDKTKENLDTLKLKNVVLGSDLAFLLEKPSTKDKQSAESAVKLKDFKKDGKLVVGIAPSIVVKKKMAKAGEDYVAAMVELVESQLAKDRKVILLPHSFRNGEGKKHNNDGPLTLEIANKISDKSNLLTINQELNPEELRHIISSCDVFVACRFHAMISSLSMAVPTLVLGWGHKYAEILKLFGQENYAMSHKDLKVKELLSNLEKVVKNRQKIHEQQTKALPKVIKLSSVHIDAIADAARQ